MSSSAVSKQDLGVILIAAAINKSIKKSAEEYEDVTTTIPIGAFLRELQSLTFGYTTKFTPNSNSPVISKQDLISTINSSKFSNFVEITNERLVISAKPKEYEDTIRNIVLESAVRHSQTLINQINELGEDYRQKKAHGNVMPLQMTSAPQLDQKPRDMEPASQDEEEEEEEEEEEVEENKEEENDSEEQENEEDVRLDEEKNEEAQAEDADKVVTQVETDNQDTEMKSSPAIEEEDRADFLRNADEDEEMKAAPDAEVKNEDVQGTSETEAPSETENVRQNDQLNEKEEEDQEPRIDADVVDEGQADRQEVSDSNENEAIKPQQDKGEVEKSEEDQDGSNNIQEEPVETNKVNDTDKQKPADNDMISKIKEEEEPASGVAATPKDIKSSASTPEPLSARKRSRSPFSSGTSQHKRFQNIAVNLINSIQAHRYSSPFLQAVNKKDAPDYYDVIYEPRNLKGILKNVKSKSEPPKYQSVKELEKDIMLMFANCVMYNKSDEDLVRLTISMKNDVINIFKMFEEAESGIK